MGAAGKGAVLRETRWSRENSAIQSDGSIRPRDAAGDDVRCLYYPSTTVSTAQNVWSSHRIKVKDCDDLAVMNGALVVTGFVQDKLVEWEWAGNKIRAKNLPEYCWGLAPHAGPDFGEYKNYFGEDNSRSKIKLVGCNSADVQEFTAIEVAGQPPHQPSTLGWRIGYEDADGPAFCIEAAQPQRQTAFRDNFLYLSRCGQNGYGSESYSP